MKLLSITIVLLTIIFSVSCGPKSEKQTQQVQEEQISGPEVEFVEHEADKRVDVMIDGRLFTSYRWPDNVYKPILYPVLTSAGTEITRGFPLKPREGERTDHMHQVGIWLNYGSVNSIDFWGAGHSGKKESDKGEIIHLSIEQLSEGADEGSMVTTESWVDPAGKALLAERTEYHFIADESTRIIDRLTTLTATGEAVSMKDTKEGMFGIRVARQLELPSEEDVTLTDAQGHPTTVKKMSNEGVTGNYRSSEGVTGEAVWGTRAKWMDLYGSIGGEKISLVICGHPENLSYPTYWHARGYGLFASNPFGVKDFTEGKEELNYIIPAGESLTLKYRVIVSSGAHLTDAEINAYADDFARKY
jgi:hypothetical protein